MASNSDQAPREFYHRDDEGRSIRITESTTIWSNTIGHAIGERNFNAERTDGATVHITGFTGDTKAEVEQRVDTAFDRRDFDEERKEAN